MPRQVAVRAESDHLSALLSLGPVLSAAPNLKTALARALEHVAEAVSARSGLIALREGDTPELSVAAATGISWQTAQRVRYKVGEGIIGRVVETAKPVVVPRASQEPLFLNRTGIHKAAAAGEDTTFVCVPICAAGACVGAVGLARPHRPDAADMERLLQFLGVVASLLGYAVRVHALQQAERQQLVAENAQLREELRERYDFRNIIGSSRPMQALFGQVTQVARSQTTVLIRGESGSGKELIAHAIHYHSTRASKPFVKVNCGALPEGLVESELFGHEAGAFTDARTARKGRFELAHGGTLFLDEVGELSLGTQVKLLRVLQEREFERLGGTQTLRVNVRLIAGDQPESRGRRPRAHVPRGPLLPPQRLLAVPAAAARPQAGHPAAGRPFRREVRRRARQGRPSPRHDRHRHAHELSLAGQRARTRELHRTCGPRGRRWRDPRP